MPDESNTDAKSAKRYEIFVPTPMVKFNLGQPDATKLTGPFGYTGVSLHADDNLFIDISKDTLYQGKNYNGQVSGTWAQYGDGGMVMSTAADHNISAGTKVLVVAGASQSSWMALNHGTNPALVAFNSIDLHYRVEEIQNGLFEFFYGRRQRAPQTVISTLLPSDPVFNRDDSTALATDESIDGGFMKMSTKSLRELFPDEDTNKKHPDLMISDMVTTKIFGEADKDKLKYGFAGTFSGFDPYGLTDPADGKNPLDKGLIMIGNAVVYMKRLADVVAKYGQLVTDNAIVKAGLKLANTVDNTVAVFDGLTQLPQALFSPIVLSFPDEFASGAGAHVKALKNAADAGADFKAAKDDALDPVKTADTRQAYVISQYGPFDFSTLGATTTVSCSWNGASPVSAVLQLQATAASVTLLPPTTAVATAASVTVSVTVDGTPYPVSVALTASAVLTPAALLPTFVTALGTNATVTAGTNGVTIASKTTGATSTVAVAVTSPSGAAGVAAAAALGIPATGNPAVGAAANVADNTAVTADEIKTALGTGAAAVLTVSSGALAVTSPTKGPGSTVSMTGPKAMLTQGWSKIYSWANDSTTLTETIADKKFVTDKTMETDDTRATRAAVDSFGTWWANMEALPSDIKNLARPLMQEVSVVSTLATNCQKLAATFNPEEWKKFLKSPSSPVGIIAANGVNLATPDKLVGVGGKGILFVADGGTGLPDWKKFVLGEGTVKRMLEWRPGFLTPTPDAPSTGPTRPPSLGFRVLSDSVVDLSATIASQVMALGRATLSDGTIGGIGIARVGASYATEIVANSKVVISARKKDPGDDAAKQGRIELAAQTIAIGGVNLDQAESKLNDFDETKGPFGIRAPQLKASYFGGLKVTDNKFAETDASDLFEPLVWSKKLTKGHPNTKKVQIHAEKEALVAVGPFLLMLDKTKGVTLGTRKSEVDPDKNEFDETKPTLTLNDTTLKVLLKKDGATIFVQESDILVGIKKNGAAVKIAEETISILPDGASSKTKIVVTKDTIAMQSGSSNTLKISSGGFKFAAADYKFL